MLIGAELISVDECLMSCYVDCESEPAATDSASVAAAVSIK